MRNGCTDCQFNMIVFDKLCATFIFVGFVRTVGGRGGFGNFVLTCGRKSIIIVANINEISCREPSEICRKRGVAFRLRPLWICKGDAFQPRRTPAGPQMQKNLPPLFFGACSFKRADFCAYKAQNADNPFLGLNF